MPDLVIISAIPHNMQRYDTCGDWQFGRVANGPTTLEIRVSQTHDPKMDFLVGLHELIEAQLCRFQGVKEEDVDEFDFHFEESRTDKSEDEPGNCPEAPYHRQHRIADSIERLIAIELGVDWNKYEETLNSL